jgi:hypothetical protein
MPVRNESEIASFDAAAGFDAIEAVAEGPIYSFVEFDIDDFNPIYVDEATVQFYEDVDHMLAHFEEIHSYANLDFMEMELFTEDLFPIANDVRYFVVSMDYLKVVRAYRNGEGVFIAVGPEEPVEPMMQALDAQIEG